MSKNEKTGLHVTWQLSNDGLRPTSAPWGFVVRNPVMRSIPPGAKIHINLNVACNHPMLAFPVRSHADDLTVPQIIQAGQEVIVTVENKSQHTAFMIEDKEGLVNLHPLVATDVTSDVG